MLVNISTEPSYSVGRVIPPAPANAYLSTYVQNSVGVSQVNPSQWGMLSAPSNVASHNGQPQSYRAPQAPLHDSVQSSQHHDWDHHSLQTDEAASFAPGNSADNHFLPPRKQIFFYHKYDPHYGFTNFSPHPVYYKNKQYPTSEHLFQSFKFEDHCPGLAEHIRTCSTRPSVALSEARRFERAVRADWRRVNIAKMDETLYHKFAQHADLRAELLATGDAELIEDSDKDTFWGIGADGRGRNELGRALERLRTRLCHEQSYLPVQT